MDRLRHSLTRSSSTRFGLRLERFRRGAVCCTPVTSSTRLAGFSRT
ncbi:MAG TPA: hypothetical protein VM821_06280 [Abditibacteriaceae bacterium]|nr:hypothetical protein [Abditibacteriaceae bacterium]